MQLTGTSFSMCIDEKLVGFSGKKYGHNVNKSSAVYFCTKIPSDKRLGALLRLLVGFDPHL